MADPTYLCTLNFMRLFEGQPQLIPVGAESHFQLSAQEYRTALELANPCGDACDSF